MEERGTKVGQGSYPITKKMRVVNHFAAAVCPQEKHFLLGLVSGLVCIHHSLIINRADFTFSILPSLPQFNSSSRL